GVGEGWGGGGGEGLAGQCHADAAVITEPTDMILAIGHKGFSWVEITTRGVAAHGSRAADGRDAILRMGRVLARLEALGRELQSRPPDPILGTASLHASLVEGGREMSTYPDRCVLKVERRTISGGGDDSALKEVEEILAALRAEDPEFEASARLMFARPPYQTPAGHDLPDLLEAAVRGAGRSASRAGMTFWTDAAILGRAGIPSVVFGPGGAGLHGLEEYVLVDDVLACRSALVNLARVCCGKQRR